MVSALEGHLCPKASQATPALNHSFPITRPVPTRLKNTPPSVYAQETYLDDLILRSGDSGHRLSGHIFAWWSDRHRGDLGGVDWDEMPGTKHGGKSNKRRTLQATY